MAMPAFTAETSLYRPIGTYRLVRRPGAASTGVYPAELVSTEPVVLAPDRSSSGDLGTAEAAGQCHSSCCANCTCCANFANTGCCRYCNAHC